MVETGKLTRRTKPTSVLVVGFATDKAKSIDVWQRTVDVFSTESVTDTVADLKERWQKENWRIEKALVRSKYQGKAAIAAVRPDIEDRVFAKVGDLLTGGEEAWERAAEEYRPMMKVLAGALSPGFTTEAVSLRRTIATVVPRMRPKTASSEKGGSK